MTMSLSCVYSRVGCVVESRTLCSMSLRAIPCSRVCVNFMTYVVTINYKVRSTGKINQKHNLSIVLHLLGMYEEPFWST